MQFMPYLTFDGCCREAFEAYREIFGGVIEAMLPYAGSPAETDAPPDWGDRIMHACLAIGEQRVMASDEPPERRQPAQGIHILIDVPDAAEAERVFGALAQGGTVTMPCAETFWALRFGMLTDRFGVPWMVNCSRPA